MTLASLAAEGRRSPSSTARIPERTHGTLEILLVEDSADWAEIVREMLRQSTLAAYNISSCERLASACAHLSQSRTDCVLLDLSLPDARGLGALREVQRIAPSVPIVLLSGLDDEDIAVEAVQEGAQDYLVKGHVDGHLLSRSVRYAIGRKRIEAELAVARELALVIGGAENVDQALQLALRKICERTGWKLGQAWLRRPGHPRLECSPAWHSASEGLEVFRKASESITFERGVGLPGTAWSTKKPVWFKDVKVDLNFPRAAAAQQVGLGAGMGVPVMTGDEVVAVLEFYVFEQREEDERLIEIVSAVAAQLGSLVLRKQAEEALRQSEERLRLVLETAHEAFIAIDARGSITAWNREAEAIFGWSRQEALGSKLLDTVIPEQYRKAHEQGLANFLATGEGPVLNRRMELSALHREGFEFPVELTISPLRIGDTYVFNAFLRDITERKRAEEELRAGEAMLAESEARYRLMATNSTDVIATSDPSGILTYVSPAVRKLFGYEPEEAVGRDFFEFCHPDDLALVSEAHRAVLESPESVTLSYRCRRRDGSFVWVEVIARQICDAQTGEITEVQSTCRDITERKLAEEGLLSLAKSLEESNRELEQFATVASHDLQEPLRKIQAFGSLLTSKYGKQFDDPGRDYLERMENAAARMQGLIDNLLTLSRVTTRARPFTAVDLEQVAQDAVADLEVAIKETGARIEVGRLPSVDADPLQMRQMMQNLISNSLKFAREDSPPVIKVYGRFRDGRSPAGEEDGDTCALFVEDNGIGFDLANLDRIFQVFERLHSHSEYEGTGMGLAICKKIANRHGGDITAWSTPGKGSTFIVTLPRTQTEESSEQ